MHKHIIRREYREDVVASLAAVSPLLRRIYAARQIETIKQLELSLSHLLPFQSLHGIDVAANIIADHIQKQRVILIVGDFDADGATSTAIAVRALYLLGAKHVYFLVPNRFVHGYGLTPELVDNAKQFDPHLIITVDNGIANHAGVDAARALGMQVVITDHHLPAAHLPSADAIVNPNQPHDEFPSKNLAGCGVIFYVMLAVRRCLAQQGWFKQNLEPNLSCLLDIVALGTVADLVPLDHNNRILVEQGLRRIRAGQAVPGIIALLELANRDFRQVTSTDLGFSVASRLNAAGRVDDMRLGIECLLCDDPLEARDIARQLDSLNKDRKDIEQEMQIQALNALQQLNEQLAGELPRGLCLFDHAWHQGVIGILASRIKDKHHRPVIVFAPSQEDEVKGSARSIHGLHIRDVLAQIDSCYPNLIKKFGGHAMAAGLTIKKNQLEDFVKIFDEVVSQHVTDAILQHKLYSDGALAVEELNLETALLLREAGPWGQAFPEPLFDDVFEVVEQRIVGDKHLKLRLMKEGKMFDGIVFFVDTKIWPNHHCQQIRALYRLEINEYKNYKNVQLIIEYLE